VTYGVATHFLPSEKVGELKELVKTNAKIEMLNPDAWVEDLMHYWPQPKTDEKIPYIDEINELF